MLIEKAYESLNLREVSVYLAHLPCAFEGFRIAHLSDLHLTPKTPLVALQTLVETLNHQAVDIIALTGDLFDAPASLIQEQLGVLKQLRHPVYFVSGNHDLMYAKASLACLVKALGFIFLDNTIKHIEKKGETLQLLGFSDAYSRYFGVKRHERALLASLDTTLPTLFLAHQPKDVRFTPNTPIVLQLSGHTHGGQIFPFGLFVRLFQPFLKGLHRLGECQIFVTNGYGSWGLKMRFLAPSEIAIITLRKEKYA